jgi:hypothetical protein
MRREFAGGFITQRLNTAEKERATMTGQLPGDVGRQRLESAEAE